MLNHLNEVLQAVYNSDVTNIHIYLDCIQNENNIVPKMYTHDDIQKIKKNIDVSDKKNIIQTETFFRDLVKINVTGDMNYHSYIKKKTTYDFIENTLILKNDIVQIEKQNFPILSNYHNIEIKNIELFEMKTIDLLIIERNDKQYQICISVKDKSQKNNKLLLSELKKFI